MVEESETVSEVVINNANENLPAILEFFKILSKKKTYSNVVAECMLCIDRKGNYSITLKATTNFIQHLQLNNLVLYSIVGMQAIAAEQTDDFFSFTNGSRIAEVGVNRECFSYLSEPSIKINMLSKYETIKYMFIKFDTTLPSSASVERLFSTAGYIQAPQINCLGNQIFENLFLKANV